MDDKPSLLAQQVQRIAGNAQDRRPRLADQGSSNDSRQIINDLADVHICILRLSDAIKQRASNKHLLLKPAKRCRSLSPQAAPGSAGEAAR